MSNLDYASMLVGSSNRDTPDSDLYQQQLLGQRILTSEQPDMAVSGSRNKVCVDGVMVTVQQFDEAFPHHVDYMWMVADGVAGLGGGRECGPGCGRTPCASLHQLASDVYGFVGGCVWAVVGVPCGSGGCAITDPHPHTHTLGTQGGQ